MALTPTQRLQARAMGMTVDWAEELLSFIGIRPDLGTFPMEYYTPEGATLSNSNFEDTFNNAIAAIQEGGKGGILQIPAGIWDIGTPEFTIVSGGRDAPVYIEGAGVGSTTLRVDVGYTGALFYLTGLPSDGAADLYYDGGIANLTITCSEEDASTTGTGIKLASCISSQFRNIDVRNFTGGSGLETIFHAPDFTNQYVKLWNFTVSSCKYNYNLTSFVNCQGYGVYSASPTTRDFLCDDVKASFFGGNMQSSAPVCFELAGNGGCVISLYDFYYEGFAGTIFKLGQPATVSNWLSVYSFHLGGTPDVFAETNAFNGLTLTAVNRIGDADIILKARNGAVSTLTNCGDPVSLPAKFDVDTASALQTVYINSNGPAVPEMKFVARAAASVTAPTLFVDIADGALKFKGAGGTTTTLAPT